MIADLSLGLLALLFLMTPGWWIARARGVPLPALAGFIFGALALLGLIQILEACHIRLSLGIMLVAWTGMILAAMFSHRRGAPALTRRVSFSLGRAEFPLLLSLIPAVAVVAYRAIAQPLSGVDTIFRWNFLAEEMLIRRTIGFYPPVTGADYSVYFWPDGIAPVVSSLYFWAYSFASEARTVLTAPIVITQFVLLLMAIYHLGSSFASRRAAIFACALAACCPILLWSEAMGQESGLLTLSLIGLLLYMPRSPDVATVPTTIAAGMAAALGGLSREYGLAFILFGLGLGLVRRLPKATLGIFLLTAVSFAAPWYVRNWARTGNPFFNLNLAGLFPVNSAHERLMEIYQGAFGWAHLPPEAMRILITNCVATAVGVVAGIFCFKQTRSLWSALALVVGLWTVSLGYTSAGFTYSLRVLAPGIAVLSIMGGIACAQWFPNRAHVDGLGIALLLFSVDASLRALVLPSNIYRIPPANWLTVGRAVHELHQRPIYRQLADFSGGRPLLILGPASLLNRFGSHTIPPWSPEVSFLWDDTLDTAAMAQALKTKGIDRFLLSKGELNDAYLSQIAFFRNQHGQSLQPIWSDEEMVLFQINIPSTGIKP